MRLELGAQSMEVMILSCYNRAKKRSDLSGMFGAKR